MCYWLNFICSEGLAVCHVKPKLIECWREHEHDKDQTKFPVQSYHVKGCPDCNKRDQRDFDELVTDEYWKRILEEERKERKLTLEEGKKASKERNGREETKAEEERK
jgi:hypothetical protein